MIIDELKNKRYFMKGKRGYIYTTHYKNKKVAIKKKNPESKAVARIANEAMWLRELNNYSIGPKLLESTNDYIIYEFVEGKFIVDFFRQADKKATLKVIKDLFKQMRQLDKLRVNKEEMHHPVKHVVISESGRATLLDFERCKRTEKPKNVTQLCQFITSNNILPLLKNNGLLVDKNRVIKLAKKYKDKSSDKNFKAILEDAH